jgi:hypothetical protein
VSGWESHIEAYPSYDSAGQGEAGWSRLLWFVMPSEPGMSEATRDQREAIGFACPNHLNHGSPDSPVHFPHGSLLQS